jgi:F5/8 type C domain
MNQTTGELGAILRAFFAGLLLLTALSASALDYPGPDPGKARTEFKGDLLMLENEVLSCRWSTADAQLKPVQVNDKATGASIDLREYEVFQLNLGDGNTLPASAFRIMGLPTIEKLQPEPGASKLARRHSGWAITLNLTFDNNITAQWRAVLRDGANAVRQQVTFTALKEALFLRSIVMVDLPAEGVEPSGAVPGLPLISGNLFFAYEHPNSVYPLTPGQGRNLALRKPAKASGRFKGYLPELAVDGDLSVKSHWGAMHLPVWLQVDLENTQTINTVRIINYYADERYYQYRIELSTDEHTWTTAVDATSNRTMATSEGVQHIFAPTKARYVRATITGNSKGERIGGHIVELQVFDTSDASARRMQCMLDINLALQPGKPLRQSSAVGVFPEGQQRRGFLYYIERERAHPYRPFLHYNSWYDTSWPGVPMTEQTCLESINVLGRELIEKRGVQLASFVWDDGWDDHQTLWRTSKQGFPHGFTNMLHAARQYNTTLGFWVSPFGGYGKASRERKKYGKEQGFEFTQERFALAGPKYYARFLETCANMIKQDGANFFKFDGLTRDVMETEAMLRLTQQLRVHRPDLFISNTVGTWPSPFWLWYGDCTWRGGKDMGAHGAGSLREQWITYRDMITYKNVVQKAPLYPLNSIMNQGIAHADHGRPSRIGSVSAEIRNEIRSFFACGTCLQELYVSPKRMAPENWDDLAEAARWSHANKDVLVDTHWIGGDPGKGEVYGWASWCKRKGILALRNPASEAATISIDIGKAFELLAGAPKVYKLSSPWKSDEAKAKPELKAGSAYTFKLAPFEVVVYDATPLLPGVR